MYPDHTEAHNNLGLALLTAGETKAAELSLRPDSAEAHYNFGLVLKKEAESQAADEEFRVAHKLDPTLTPP
jgi:Tfp pilus assembly protein PilF